ncbi:MAG TPA: L,D-transpeptidase family protein [Sphingomicrobium sp.]|nr:L,D-transpeptidase family protein [Sphingomicrobium sp.]
MNQFARLFASVTLLAVLSSPPARAQGAPKSAALELAKEAERLRPGQWVWKPEIAPKGPILVYVDLGRQLATVYRNGIRIGVSTISSGRPGYETPTGVFTILEKNKEHISRKYNDAPMPYQERLTWGGVALHAGGLPGYPESHGCVHLPLAFSKLLYGSMPLGGTVIIAGGHEDPVKRPPAGVLAPAIAGATTVRAASLDSDANFTWNPAAALSGPVSIIVSTGDQQVVVLRNGVEIGRAHADVQQQTSEPQVMTLAAGKDKQWIEVGVSELTAQHAEVISTERVEQMHLPAEFVKDMRSAITPGTTVLVTQASVTGASTGVQTTVLDSDPPAK